MPASEFAIIAKHFAKSGLKRDDVMMAIGDDAAVCQPPAGQRLLVTTDTLVENIHFYSDVNPESLGHKALAVNLSDLAAMGATPAWVSLALTLPRYDETWLTGFCRGFFALANRHRVQLIGGDMTHGPLSITITAQGFAAPEKIIYRHGAKVGDGIFVSRVLGGPAAALTALNQGEIIDMHWRASLEKPNPSIDLGLALAGHAHSCIDISDGLLADLSHILERSQVGAILYLDAIPLDEHANLTQALHGGDEYALCFTMPDPAQDVLREQGFNFYRIGEVTEPLGIICLDRHNQVVNVDKTGYDHFTI